MTVQHFIQATAGPTEVARVITGCGFHPAPPLNAAGERTRPRAWVSWLLRNTKPLSAPITVRACTT
jgi:hypothetical protein